MKKSHYSTQAEAKSALRTRILAARKALLPEEQSTHAQAASTYLLATELWKGASTVLLYMPIRQELDSTALLENAWSTGKNVFLPRCHATEKGLMDLALCRSYEDLVVGRYGIVEPNPTLCPALDFTETMQSAPNITLIPDIALIPAVGFDKQGNRLGYGGGYYDRLFAHEMMAKTCRIGFAHGVQVVDALPCEAWDCLMHGLCTEHGLTWIDTNYM